MDDYSNLFKLTAKSYISEYIENNDFDDYDNTFTYKFDFGKLSNMNTSASEYTLKHEVFSFVNGVDIRSYDEVKNFIDNMKDVIKNKILIAFENDNANLIKLYANMLSEYQIAGDIKINMDSYRRVNDNLFILDCEYAEINFKIVMSKKEYADAKIRK